MTKQEYLKVQIGDMIKIKWNGRIVTIKGENSPWFKFRSGNTDGFMVGNVFYGYKQCAVVKEVDPLTDVWTKYYRERASK